MSGGTADGVETTLGRLDEKKLFAHDCAFLTCSSLGFFWSSKTRSIPCHVQTKSAHQEIYPAPDPSKRKWESSSCRRENNPTVTSPKILR